MTCDMEGMRLEKPIKERTLACNDRKSHALGLPPYHHASEWATGSNAIATNTPYDDPSAPKEEFPVETAGVETSAMRKVTSNGAEPASTLHRHAAHIKETRRTSAVNKTVCSVCNTVANHRSDRCP